MIGITLGRYRLLEELGRGTMGIVYRAHDPAIQRDVAIKTLRDDFAAEEGDSVRERFLREARSAGCLSHPSIVIVHDVGESDGIAYIAMELLPGQSLKALLGQPERLPFATVLGLAAQIADALDYAQSRSIVHRDVKPANIMVTAPGVAKLTDFGIAYMATGTDAQTDMLGSPKYMSPEQVMGETIDGRSDLFSLGVVLYEMLARKNPFERPGDSSVFKLMQRIATTPHQRVSELDPSIPRSFDVVLARALAKDPARRYQRGAAFAKDLRALHAMLETAAQGDRRGAPGPTAGGGFSTEGGGVLGMLRQKAAGGAAQSLPALPPEAIDVAMRGAFRYLNEFAKELAAARPASARRVELIYLGQLPELVFASPFVDYRTRQSSEAAHCDRVLFTARLEAPRAVELDLMRDEIPAFKAALDRLRFKYDVRETKNDFGLVMRARFTLQPALPVNAELRADYATGAVHVDLSNVGTWGPAKFDLPIGDLDDDWLEEFGKLILGMDSRLGAKVGSRS